MKNGLALLLLIFFCFSACNSDGVRLKRKRTDEHQHITRSRIFVVPPGSAPFSQPSYFIGFMALDKSWEISTDPVGKSVATLDKEYSKGALKLDKQADLLEKKKVVHPEGYHGFYVNYVETERGDVVHLIILHADDVVMRIQGRYKAELSESLDKPMKESIQGLYVGSFEEVREEQSPKN